MEIQTLQQRKALRDGYCAGLRGETIDENPHKSTTDLFKIWEYGRNNLPEVWHDEIAEIFIVKWICFKCGEKYELERVDESKATNIWKDLMLGHNYCRICDKFPI